MRGYQSLSRTKCCRACWQAKSNSEFNSGRGSALRPVGNVLAFKYDVAERSKLGLTLTLALYLLPPSYKI